MSGYFHTGDVFWSEIIASAILQEYKERKAAELQITSNFPIGYPQQYEFYTKSTFTTFVMIVFRTHWVFVPRILTLPKSHN